MSLSSREIHNMQAAAEVPGVEYSVFVADTGVEGHVVNVAFTGLVDQDHAGWFAKYISLLLELNSVDNHMGLPN